MRFDFLEHMLFTTPMMFAITIKPRPPAMIKTESHRQIAPFPENCARLSEYGENPALQNAETERKTA